MGVRQLIWNGSIPLEIHINDPENILIGTTSTLPFYVKIPLKSPFNKLVVLDNGEEVGVLSYARQ